MTDAIVLRGRSACLPGTRCWFHWSVTGEAKRWWRLRPIVVQVSGERLPSDLRVPQGHCFSSCVHKFSLWDPAQQKPNIKDHQNSKQFLSHAKVNMFFASKEWTILVLYGLNHHISTGLSREMQSPRRKMRNEWWIFSLLNGALEDLWLGVVGYKSRRFGCAVLIGSTDSFVAWLSLRAMRWGMLYVAHLALGHFQDPPEADLRSNSGPHAQWGGLLPSTNLSDIKQWVDEECKT